MELENDMPTLAERSEAVARRRARFVDYVKRGLSSAQIADLEGIREDNASTERREIAKEEGLPLPKRTRGSQPPLASGVMEVSSLVRSYLKMQLEDLKALYAPEDLQVLTGLNPSAQNAACRNPYTHNWTIGQLSRVAAVKGITFEQLMRDALNHKPIGFK